MTKGLFKQGLNAFLLVVVAAFLLVSLFSAVGQQLFPRIGHYQADIERYLQENLELDITLGKIWGDMDVLTPALHIENVTLHTEAIDTPQLYIAAIDTVLDPYQSLSHLTPVFKEIRLSGVSIDLRHLAKKAKPETEKQQASEQPDESNSGGVESIVAALLLQHSVEVNGLSIITHVNGQDRTLNFEQLALKGDGFHRLINGHISYGEIEKQIKTGFRIYSEGNPYDLDTFYARGVIDLPDVDIAFWLREFLGQEQIEELDASAQLSFEFENGLLQSSRLALATTRLKVVGQPQLKHLNTTVWLKQHAAKDWTAWLENASFSVADQRWSLGDLGLKLARQPDGNRWQIFTRELDLSYLQKMLDSLDVMPSAVDEKLRELSPTGKLTNATFVLNTKVRADTEFTFASQVEGLSIQPSGGIPGVQNLTGVIAANKRVGRVQFDGKDLQLSFPDLYEQPFEFQQAKGQVEWFIEPKQIRLVGDGLSLSMTDVEKVKGGFQLWLSQVAELDSQLMLNLAIENADATAHSVLVPKVLNEGLRTWLDEGIQGGDISRGQLVFFSSLAPNSPSPLVELYLDVKNASLKYLEDWPQIDQLNGQVFVDSKQVRVVAPSAVSLGGQVRNGVVLFGDDKHKQPALWVALQAKGVAQEGLDYFTQTPLQEIVSGALDQWTLSGSQNFAMALKVPMASDSKESISIDLTSRLSRNDLAMNDLDLTFGDVSGTLGYSSAKGLYSNQLTATLWGQPASVNVASEFPDGSMVTRFDIDGALNTQGLKKWTRLGLLESLQGQGKVQGVFTLDTREGQTSRLQLQSDLAGIAINLPRPFGLSADATRALNFDMALGSPLTMSLQYGKQVGLTLALQDGALERGHIHLGADPVTMPEQSGLLITGHVAHVNAAKWLPVLKRIEKADEAFAKQNTQPAETETANPIRQVLVSVGALEHGEQRFTDIKLNANHHQGDWTFDLDAPIAKGLIKFPKQGMLDADLLYVHLPAPESENEPTAEDTESEADDAQAEEAVAVDEDPLQDFDPKVLPKLHVKVGELFVGPTNYGSWDVTTQPDENGVGFLIASGRIKKLDMSGELYWYKQKNHHTQLKLNLVTDDVGGIQKAWRLKPAIEARKGRGDLFINWLGSPAAFNVASLSGDVNFKLQNGSFVEAKDAEALNAFGILNFASIGRRLRLDFRDLYTEGLAFDQFDAKLKLNNGLITIVDTMNVAGPAAKFSTSGTINLNDKQLNQQLSVTFPVSSTLPLVAILAGFAPPVAASIFVGERLVGDQIERFTSATYDIKGPWDDPKLELNKRFDNEIEGKKSKTFWHRMKDVFGLGKD